MLPRLIVSGINEGCVTQVTAAKVRSVIRSLLAIGR